MLNPTHLLKEILKGEKVNPRLILKNKNELLNLCKTCDERSQVIMWIDLALD